MSGSVNKVILVGNLGRDPEIRSTQDGTRIANLSLATSETWRDRQTGERREKTEWHRVVVFDDRLIDVIERYVKKGAKLYLEGQLQTRKWSDQSGQERYSTEVVLQRYRGEMTMLDGRGGGGGGDDFAGGNYERDYGGAPSGGGSSGGGFGGGNAPAPGPGDLDDDIPF